MPKKILIAVTNHPPDSWGDEQKAGWDEIVFIPFPNLSPDLPRKELMIRSGEITDTILKIVNKYNYDNDVYFWIAGEYLLTISIILNLLNFYSLDRFIFPTTERVVVEERLETGEVIKKSIFKFVQWR